MCFIQRHVLDIFFSYDRADSELNLRTRRPDLWTLPLTCENTKKTVPYLEIVNEILERYIATKQGHTPLNDPTADRAAVEGVVYRQTLAQGRDSFVQPFSLPHATVREYLSAFTDERSQADVARALGLGDDRVSAAEWKLSQAELSLITQTAIGLGTLRKLYNVGFSVEAASGLVKPFDAQLLLPATRLSRADLETVLDTRFVSADGTEHAHITPEKFDSNSVQNDIERIHGLRLSSLDRLHRFTRLWRRTDWSVIELDLLLEHLEKATLATGIGSTAVNTLVFIRQLQQRFGISAEACCALFSELPTRPLSAEPSFFDRLFNLPDFVLADGALPNNAAFIHPALRVAPTAATDSKLQRVPAGLRVSDEQLYQLIGALAAPLGVDLNTSNETDRGFVLNIANLTLLYRHARLAEWLDLDIPSLFQLIRLTPALGSGYVGDLDTIEALLARIDWWRSTAVTLDDLAWATGGDVRFPDAYPAPVDLAGAMIQGMLDERALHFANTVFAFSENITEAQSRDIVAANAARVSTAPDGSYTLADDYDPGVALTIPASAAGVDEASLRSVLSFYYATEIIPGRLSGALGFTPDKLAAILRLSGADLLDTSLMAALKGMDPGNPDDALVDLIRDVQPLATVLADVLFDVDSVDFLRANPGLVGVSNWNALTLTQLQSVFAFGELKRRALAPKHGSQLPLSTGEFHTLLSGFTATGGYANADGDVLARLLDAELGLVLPVLETVTVSGGALTHLGTLSWCVAIAQHLGVGGDALPLIASSDFDELRQASDKLLSALRASFDIESDFTRTIEPHNDVIRTQKRVALVDYLLRSDDFDFENERHLYHHFLLDVETGGCARTTPLAAAISSAQLYVHRCVMNLEQDARAAGDTNKIHVFPGAIPRAEWAWRKSYRTWEANRKIFLWPENYLEPTLRDNKTSLFEELESDLLQQPITEQTARDAYARYLRGFDEIATLRIAGSYHHKDARNRTDVLHLFGVTPSEPPTHYYRAIENAEYGETMEGRGILWGAWKKVDVQIPVSKATPIVFKDRLYVFWVQLTTRSESKISDGGSRFTGYHHTMSLSFTNLRLDNTWSSPQRVVLSEDPFRQGSGVIKDWLAVVSPGPPTVWSPRYEYNQKVHADPIDGYTLGGFRWDRVYPGVVGGKGIFVTGRDLKMHSYVDLRNLQMPAVQSLPSRGDQNSRVLCADLHDGNFTLYFGFPSSRPYDEYAFRSLVASSLRIADFATTRANGEVELVTEDLYDVAIARLDERDELDIVNGSFEDAVITASGDVLYLQGAARDDGGYIVKRLGSTLSDAMRERLYNGGIDTLLATETQRDLGEADLPIGLLSLIADKSNAGVIDFRGSLGTYFREIFFHIPFLIANHLNSQGDFAAAQRWYHFIFDPTSTETLDPVPGLAPEEEERRQRDRNWRYVEFRGLDIATLRDQLSDGSTLEAYRRNPFNPHAIARLRLTAYQKAVAMKYVDNLLDWADSLFTKFERESLNEAVMLYVLARDILGDPPVELGQCGEEGIAPATFEDIAPAVKGEQGFVVDMENWKTPALVLGANTNRFVTTRAMTAAADPPDEDEGDRELWRYSPRAGTSEDLGTSLIGLLGGGFCVPGNKALRKYWERVEGRLYNIRHCLDIHGVPRAPAPFAPEIDPALLAEAGATGLALDDVTDAISGSLPPYRFTALVERAKSYAATLQSFGAELFSALEKKDAEALNRLRTVHQQNLLGLTTRIREDEITAAQDAIDGLGFRKAGAEYQLGHYQSLLDTGLIAPESTQMDAQMLALLMKFAGGTVGALTGVLHLVPDVGAPTALKYGGSSLGASMGSFAGAVGSFASVFDSQAASAGLTASFDRRKQGWEHQIKLAKQEIEQLGKQLEGAEMRKRIAERSLEIHQQSIEHLDEISGFYREKFSNLGLYTWLSTTLQRLYRETYQSAWAMARLAEQAYRFERDDDSGLVATGVWDTFRTGLLAGERLLVDLQTMERRFLETDSRSLAGC